MWHMDIIDQLLWAIDNSKMTLHEISMRAGLADPIVYRFVSEERGITLASASKLCRVLGLSLIDKKRRKMRGR